VPEAACHCGLRRRFIGRLLLALPAFAALPAPAGAGTVEQRRLQLVNTHTGERLDEAYFEDGAYLPARMGMFDWVLRDHRSNDIFPIDRQLFDLLHELAASAGVLPRYQIISGYRSPATNAMLVTTTDGVSSQSLHMQGKAIDVRLEGVPAARLREVALARKAGGVGYYPASDFVHLDIGRVRSWSG
jgi:uncharacterized protein YcbK (DUF882 family)